MDTSRRNKFRALSGVYLNQKNTSSHFSPGVSLNLEISCNLHRPLHPMAMLFQNRNFYQLILLGLQGLSDPLEFLPFPNTILSLIHWPVLGIPDTWRRILLGFGPQPVKNGWVWLWNNPSNCKDFHQKLGFMKKVQFKVYRFGNDGFCIPRIHPFWSHGIYMRRVMRSRFSCRDSWKAEKNQTIDHDLECTPLKCWGVHVIYMYHIFIHKTINTYKYYIYNFLHGFGVNESHTLDESPIPSTLRGSIVFPKTYLASTSAPLYTTTTIWNHYEITTITNNHHRYDIYI